MDAITINNQRKAQASSAVNGTGFSVQAPAATQNHHHHHQHHPKIQHKSAEPSLSIQQTSTQLPSVQLGSVKPSQKKFITKAAAAHAISSYMQESDNHIHAPQLATFGDASRKTNVSYAASSLHSYNQPSQRDSQQHLNYNEPAAATGARLDDYFQSMQSHQQMLQQSSSHLQYRSTGSVGQNGMNHHAAGPQSNQQRLQNIYRSTSQAVSKGNKTRQAATTTTTTNVTSNLTASATAVNESVSNNNNNNSYQQYSTSAMNNQRGVAANIGYLSNTKAQQHLKQPRDSIHTQGNPESTQLGEEDEDQKHHRTPFKSMAKNRLNRNRTTENQQSRGIASHQLQLQQSQGMPMLNAGGNSVQQQLYASPEVMGLRAHSQQRQGQQNRLQPINLTNKISTFACSANDSNIAANQSSAAAQQLQQNQNQSQQQMIPMNQKPSITSGSYVINSEQVAKTSIKYFKSDSQMKRISVPTTTSANVNKTSSLTNKSIQNPMPQTTSAVLNNHQNLKQSTSSGYQQKIPLHHKKEGSGRQNGKQSLPLQQQQPPDSEVRVNESKESKDELLVTFFDKNFALDNSKNNSLTEEDRGSIKIQSKEATNEKLNFDRFQFKQVNSEEQHDHRTSVQLDHRHNIINRHPAAMQHHTPIHDKSDNFRYSGGPQGVVNHHQTGQRSLILQQVQHKSQKNLASSSAASVNQQHQRGTSSISLDLNDRQIQDQQTSGGNHHLLNNSMNLRPSGAGTSASGAGPQIHHQASVELKNLHPQGLYIGGAKQRKQNKTAAVGGAGGGGGTTHQQSSTANHKAEADELLTVNRQQKLNHSQGSDLGLGHLDQNSSSAVVQPDGNESLQALNQSMLVQECDLSQGTGLQDISGVVHGAADSDRMSAHSISNNGNSKFNYFKGDQFNHRGQSNNHSVDTSPMTKTYNLKNKINYKSKVNMKSFLLNNVAGKGRKQIAGPQSIPTNEKIIENDRASQRSIVESTNAYIRATHQNANDGTNRIQYLQSAGTIGGNYPHGNGLSDTDINGSSSRIDHIASSSIPYRANIGMTTNNNMVNAAQPHSMHHSSQQHLMQTAGTPDVRVQAAAHSRGKLRPLDQQLFNLKPGGQQLSEQAPLGHSRDLDPDMTLFQLRQEVHRVPQDNGAQSRQGGQLVGLHPQPFQLADRHKNLTQGDPGGNSYQTIAMPKQRSGGDSGNQILVGARDLPNYMLSAEKTRYELQSQQNIYHPRLEASLSTSSHIQSSNMSTIINGNHLPAQAHHKLSAKPNKPKHSQTNGSEANHNRLDQNPFQKGPKLHLFKKSRRLKTSSATRQAHEEGSGPAAMDHHHPAQTNDDQQATITSGIGPTTTQQRMQIQQRKQNALGLDTNTTTINTVSQQSYSNVYGTIEHKAKAGGAHQMLSAPDMLLQKQSSVDAGKHPHQASNAGAGSKNHQNNSNSTAPLRMIGMINQSSEEKQGGSTLRGGSGAAVNPAASPYQDQMHKIDQQQHKSGGDSKLRPHTSEMFQTSSTINDMYGDGDDENEWQKANNNLHNNTSHKGGLLDSSKSGDLWEGLIKRKTATPT